jgi:LysM repeat protein
MKIMKVLGVVVSIHLFALVLIFANPGCSSTTKTTPVPTDTVAKSEPAPSVAVTGVSPGVNVSGAGSPVSAPPASFNPDAPATAAGGGAGVRFNPTRPGTPAASTLVAEPVSDVTPASTYAVKSGDSLWTIAKKNGLAVADLAAANNLKASASLREGQKLVIPAKRAAAAAAASKASAPEAPPAKAPADAVKHTVKSGETLGTIARKYGVKQGDVAVANNITDPQKVRAGMELVIPGSSGAAANKSARPHRSRPRPRPRPPCRRSSRCSRRHLPPPPPKRRPPREKFR